MARGITRVNKDTAGGTLISTPNKTVYANGLLIAAPDSRISPHGKRPHRSAVMVSGSGNVFVEGNPVCREGDSASCGHTSSGSRNVFCN